VSKVIPGQPAPEIWRLRGRVKGGRVIHAVRGESIDGPREYRSACLAFWMNRYGVEYGYGSFVSVGRPVTCKACRKRMAKPLSRSEAWVFNSELRQ
jgi:hypothetical protein